MSNTTVSSEAACSSAIAFLNRMPRLAPSPVPTMMAVGVASPSASGQVMTTTVMANSSASWTSRPTMKYQTTNVSAPPTSATSTSQNAARSASRCPGALEFCASWTSLTICASAVSAPTAVARARRVPFLLMVAPMSWSPAVFLTGRLSPVTVDSSTWLSPSSTTASTGHLRARADEQQVADLDLGGRDLDGLAVAQDDGLGRREVEQGADGVVGAAAGAHLEPVAEQHERGEHARGLVEDLALDEERRRDRVQPRGADGDGDQHHHVQRPVAQRGRPRR